MTKRMQLYKHLARGNLVYLSQDEDAISISENEHFRWLAFNDVVQSFMHKRKPWTLTLPHQTALLLPLLFFRPAKIVELGLGGGNLGRFLAHLSAKIALTTVEYNGTVIACFNKFFNPDKNAINVIKSEGATWLSQQDDTAYDWLICDTYQDNVQTFKQTMAQLEAITHNVHTLACLSINLPDVNDAEINLILSVLQQVLPEHQLIYFHIPNYHNIVIHLCPIHWQLNSAVKKNKNSYLPRLLHKRWQNFWRYGKRVN